MTTKQKRAIWYALREKRLERQFSYIVEHGLLGEWHKSDYKTYTWFLKAKGGAHMSQTTRKAPVFKHRIDATGEVFSCLCEAKRRAIQEGFAWITTFRVTPGEVVKHELHHYTGCEWVAIAPHRPC